jgi:hypothetical protein
MAHTLHPSDFRGRDAKDQGSRSPRQKVTENLSQQKSQELWLVFIIPAIVADYS